MERWNFWIAIVALLTLIVTSQRTYMRTCECEYTQNGQCAYTLLLPLGQGQSEATCPAGNDQSNSSIDPNMNEALSNIEQSIHELESNITQLQLNSGDQARMLSQLQSKVMDHSDTLEEIQRQIEEIDETDDGLRQGLNENIQQNMEHINALESAFLDLYAAVNQTQVLFQELLSNITQMQSFGDIQNMTSMLNETVHELQSSFTAQVETIQTQVNSYNLCAQKGILASGATSEIRDEAMTSSSERDDATAEMVRITSVSGWCTQAEPNEDEWVQFDFGATRALYGVVTKGRADYAQWVTSYKVQYGDVTDNLMTFTDVLGEEQIFPGNQDQTTAQTNMFWQPIRARYLRILPLSSYENRNQCMRADVIGCVQ